MKRILPLAAAAMLTGCISLGSQTPSKVAGNAAYVTWTSLPPDRVLACISRTVGAPIQANSVTGRNGTRYEIGAPTSRKTVYETQISQFGRNPENAALTSAINLCSSDG